MWSQEIHTETPGLDPDELDGFGQDATLVPSDEDLAELANRVGAKGGFRGAAMLDDPAYRGKLTSRKEMFEDTNGWASGSEEEDPDATEVTDMRSSDDEGQDDSDAVSSQPPSGGDGSASEGERQESSPYGEDGSQSDGDDAEMRALEAQTADTYEADAVAMMGLRSKAAQERVKGVAVRNQKKLWDKALGLRIVLQKVLVGANKLPAPEAHAAAAMRSEAVSARFQCLAESAGHTLDMMAELMAAQMEQNLAIEAAASGGGLAGGASPRSADDSDGGVGAPAPQSKRRPRDDADESEGLAPAKWAKIEALEAAGAPYRDQSCDRWHRKAMLSGGRMTSKAQMRALDQSLSQQVRDKLRNVDKMIERTQLAATRIAAMQNGAAGVGPSDGGEAAGDGGDDEEELDPETFDDADFYQTLLKEFLEGNMSESAGIKILASQRRKKNVVDRRASKGRKLRYHVIDKLVNFMPPQPQQRADISQNLFSNLFNSARAQP